MSEAVSTKSASSRSKIESLFRETGAVLDGHFLLSSGQHSPTYWEKFRVLQYPAQTQKLCRMIARHFAGQPIDLVAGPTVGGIILAYEVARQLGLRAIYAEREDKKRVFRRGLSIQQGEKVLVIDDVLTTGHSVQDVIDAVTNLGGVVAGVGVLLDRSVEPVDFGAPFFSCHTTEVPVYPPDRCPLCARGLPLIKPGSSPS